MGDALGRPELAQHQHRLARLPQGGRQGLGNGGGEVGMLGGEGIEAAAVEGAGLDIGQRLAFEGVPAVDVEVADTVARGADGDDLAAAVIQGARHCDDARPDLEKRPHGVAGAKEHLTLLPAADAAEAEHHLKTRVVERLAQVERPADTAVARQASSHLRPAVQHCFPSCNLCALSRATVFVRRQRSGLALSMDYPPPTVGDTTFAYLQNDKHELLDWPQAGSARDIRSCQSKYSSVEARLRRRCLSCSRRY